MNTADLVSIAASIASIALAIYAISYAKGEARKSQRYYDQSKELLYQIEKESKLIDRSIQIVQQYVFDIINKLLDSQGKESVDGKTITMAEIEEIIDGKTAEAKESVRKMEETINNMPRIFVGSEEPKDAKDGDIWIQS